ncbi:hypothetical protein T484DRAFT_1837186 [Baffinella frigidus]|nr:hypothetical protein T484DRAFT_1837186 [Cryptophyta sp. CCMP2293]
MNANTYVGLSIGTGVALVSTAYVTWDRPQENPLLELRFWEIVFASVFDKCVMVNAFCNLLFLLGRTAQTTLVGPLREIEKAAVFDRIRAYLLVKIEKAAVFDRFRAYLLVKIEKAAKFDRFRAYLLVKVVFIGAVLPDHDEKEIMVWAAWLMTCGLLRHMGLQGGFRVWAAWLMTCGLLKHMGLLARDRLEYMTLSVNTTRGRKMTCSSPA